jgi:hypothetical protein
LLPVQRQPGHSIVRNYVVHGSAVLPDRHEDYFLLQRLNYPIRSCAAVRLCRSYPMARHTDAILSAVAGFVLTGAVMVPPVLSARAEKADRIAAYEQDLGPSTTRFGGDRAGRLASLLRDEDYQAEARRQLAASRPHS